MTRNLSGLDKLIGGIDRSLRTLTDNSNLASRKIPQTEVTANAAELSERERRHAAGLMRVNHSGEVCAQALYQGQALTARLPQVREEMEKAAEEEVDHLAWCESRLKALDSQPSLLNPLWYTLSFGIGAGAGLISDRLSLGFVAATEELVCKHLDGHLQSLPEGDTESRAVVTQMLEDEGKHAEMALASGGLPFPQPLKGLMSAVSKVMTTASYKV
jgi:Ubiquinone biosynthesis protein COQ7